MNQASTVPPTIWKTFNEGKLSSKVLLFGVMINRLSGFLQIFIVIFLMAHGYTHEQTITALAFYGGGAIIGALAGGYLSEKLGIRVAVTISMSATAILTASLLYISTFWLLLFFVTLSSLSAQLFRPASATLLSRQTPPEQQTMIFAIYRLGINLGTTFAPALGYFIYHLSNNSFIYLFWIEAVIAGLYALLAFLTLPDNRQSEHEKETTDNQPGNGYKEILKDRRFMFYLFATLCHAIVYVQYTSTLPLFIEDVHYPIYWYTLAISLNSIIVISFELLLTKYTQQYAQHIVIAVGFILVGLGVACYALPIGPMAIIIGTVIWSIGEIICGPAFSAWPANAGPDRLKAHYLGSCHFMFNAGGVIGPLVGGWLYLQMGMLIWPIISFASVIAAVTCWQCCSPRAPRQTTASAVE
ncbi:MFS transporter [Musicola keenii]|uniref:MFS transporter n=1 Tax=Musicola keenii TaxID=2884250 RepID=UPI001780BE50|nr:MFS transporter [Musicola keenii]